MHNIQFLGQKSEYALVETRPPLAARMGYWGRDKTERLQSNLIEITVKDKDVAKDDFVGRIVFDIVEVLDRVPPDSSLAPQREFYIRGEGFKLPHHSMGFVFDGFIKLQGKKPKRRIRGLRDGNLQDIGTPSSPKRRIRRLRDGNLQDIGTPSSNVHTDIGTPSSNVRIANAAR
ncbi:FT-interacting 1 [Olea europaea subsp. europaea]|uniref:FT-interacting 1 n=1 Tax=Olea europaea subsp. europaea TaxID=158383 RepID=A0A8S0QFA6_OLEEU|nr:FT-interacting 1 [Olea europaea subsp. europaea]